MRKRACFLVSFTMVGTITPAAHANDVELASRFTLGVLPDTQFYSRYSTDESANSAMRNYGSEPYLSQTTWLARHHDEIGMPFVTHLGDIVDQADVAGEWEVASEAMKALEDADLDYSILPGNHDLSELHGNAYLHYFPQSRAELNETFEGRFTDVRYNESEYHIFEAEGQKYLVLALGWRAGDEALNWAQKVIDEHPTLPVILTSHEISNIDGSGKTYFSEDYGQHLWDKFIKKNDQIFLTMGGHHHGAGYHVATNDAGNPVINILQDYQMAYMGGNGLLGVVQFDLSNNTLEMTALSPWVADKPTESLNQFDHLILEGPGDSYTVDLNFSERFSGFAPTFTKGDENDPDYAERARDIVREGYTPFEIKEDERPQGDDDYVRVAGTVAHWRPSRLHDDGTLPDISGNGNDMVPVGTPAVRTNDAHPLSADGTSLSFDPALEGRPQYYTTSDNAPVNSINLNGSYTIEAFLKLDKDWDGEVNGWSNALAREKQISASDGDPLAMLGISNLRELRWYGTDPTGDGASVWSHEVPADEWMHVAVVNNADTGITEMFVNGAPILRNVSGPVGLGGKESKWLIGTSTWNSTPSDPWNGSVGEMRIVDRALEKDEWLTARAHENTGSASDNESVEPEATGSSSSSNLGWLGSVAGLVGLLTAVGALALSHLPLIERTINDLRRQFNL